MKPQHQTDFDYSTPDAQAALAGVTDLILEIHEATKRKTVLYERTLGLAVIPVLLRRAAIVTYRKIRQRSQGIK